MLDLEKYIFEKPYREIKVCYHSLLQTSTLTIFLQMINFQLDCNSSRFHKYHDKNDVIQIKRKRKEFETYFSSLITLSYVKVNVH